jgi:hypothetical protein
MKKLAVFIAGPIRYVKRVVERLDFLFKEKISYKYFIFLWNQDLGNKTRLFYDNDYMTLIDHDRLSLLIIEEAYTEDEIKKIYDVQEVGHSTINATIGMFYSMNRLIRSLSIKPDSKEYTHVLRIRTDCLILNNNFIDMLDFETDDIIVSKNCLIPNDQVSDHIMFAKKNIFERVWGFDSLAGMMQEYKKNGANPEVYLSYKLKGYAIKDSIIRYKDYYIIYNPPKNNDALYIKKMVSSKEGIYKLFNETSDVVKYQDILFYYAKIKAKREIYGVYEKLKPIRAIK